MYSVIVKKTTKELTERGLLLSSTSVKKHVSHFEKLNDAKKYYCKNVRVNSDLTLRNLCNDSDSERICDVKITLIDECGTTLYKCVF